MAGSARHVISQPAPQRRLPGMPLRLYDYAASANCLKVRLLLTHLCRPYERVPVDIFDGDTLTDDFARLNPARSTPVLELESGVHLQESNAILVYLAEGTELLPDAAFERAQVMRWLFFEQADLVPAIGGLRFRVMVTSTTSSPTHPMRRQGQDSPSTTERPARRRG